MNLKLKSMLSVLVIAAVVVTSSCSAVIGTLDGIIDGVTALVPIVTAASSAGEISVPAATIVMDYLEATSTAASNAITEWESNDPEPVKIAAISADFAGIAAPELGPGVSAVIQVSISAISKLIAQLLDQLTGTQAPLAAQKSSAALRFFENHKLKTLKSHSDKNVAAIEAWKAQQRVRAAGRP